MGTTTLLTADELLRMPDDDPFHELVDGKLITMSPPGFGHGLCRGRLHVALSAFVGRRRLGVVVPQDTGPSSSRATPTPCARRTWPSCPSTGSRRVRSPRRTGTALRTAVEVLSPGERFAAAETKVREYLACGARAAWVVRPRTRTVSIYHADEPPVVFTEGDAIEDPLVLPGFRYALRRLFEDLPTK